MKLYSIFDSLTILSQLRDTFGTVSFGEICLYAYMACWLFVYRSNSPTGWGYVFSATQTGAPYSLDLQAATAHLLRAGHVAESVEHMSITDRGRQELQNLSAFAAIADRTEYLEAACSTTLVLPSGVLRGAIAADADITAARTMNSSREMFTEEALTQMRGDFFTMKESLGTLRDDLLAAAAVWATYMSEQTLDPLATTHD